MFLSLPIIHLLNSVHFLFLHFTFAYSHPFEHCVSFCHLSFSVHLSPRLGCHGARALCSCPNLSANSHYFRYRGKMCASITLRCAAGGGVRLASHCMHSMIAFDNEITHSFPFVRGEVLPATFSPPHLLVFSTLL